MLFLRWLKKQNKVDCQLGSEEIQSLYKDYISVVEKPTSKEISNNINFIAVDFETTGLHSKKHEILSMGFCPIKDNSIQLGDCLHITIKPTIELKNDNVIIHKLTDDILNRGVSAERALQIFLKQTKNKVIIAHHHRIEKTFIQELSKKILGKVIPVVFIDTLMLAEKLMVHNHPPPLPNSFRLFNLRKQYGLPNYNAHNALEDAISTAELFLAQISDLKDIDSSSKKN